MRKIHNNPIFLSLVALIALVAVWYTYRFIGEYIQYSHLSQTATVEEVHWTTKEINSDLFVPEAFYQFQVDGKSIQGHSVLEEPIYRNPISAEQDLVDFNEQTKRVWYNPNDPSLNSLEKNFPVKEAINAGVLWLIVCYFIGLGVYVAGRK